MLGKLINLMGLEQCFLFFKRCFFRMGIASNFSQSDGEIEMDVQKTIPDVVERGEYFPRKNRSMTNINAATFRILKEAVRQHLDSQYDLHDKICIESEDSEAREWLLEAQFCGKDISDAKLKISSSVSLIKVKFKDLFYIVITGFNPETEVEPEYLSYCEPNGGIFNLLASNGVISPDVDSAMANWLYNEFLYSSGDEVKKIPYSNLTRAFTSFCMYELKSEGVLFDFDLSRVAAYLLIREKENKKNGHLIQCYNELVFSGVEKIPFYQIANSILNLNDLRHAFLYLYRCLERLYAYPAITELKEKLNAKHDIDDLSRILENVTGWRQKEDDGLQGLIGSLENNDIGHCFSILGVADDKEADLHLTEKLSRFLSSNGSDKELRVSLVSNLSKSVYKTRNAIVHYRATFDEVELDDNKVEKLSVLLLYLIQKLYARYSD